MLQYADDIARAAYQQSQGGGPSTAGFVGSMIGNVLLWTAMENAVNVNAVGLSRNSITGKFLNWISRGKLSVSPLESVTSRMEGWIYAKNPGMGFFMPNAGMRQVSKATYSALGDLMRNDVGKVFTKEGGRLLVGSIASFATTAFSVGMIADFADLGITLGKSFFDRFAEVGRKFMFAPWNMSMTDNTIPVSRQYQAMHQQAVQQLMQSRRLIAQGDSTTYNRSLYNNPYDFYNFI